ncbi:37S ribosomal protein S24, mitochondrial [Erysiphe necator]|uniref:Putative 37s ribosomal protein n=1 Tax=Uncinula necator TaxID=52586 RepID=A0A0B1PFL6_UNCNE|nr:37S ribosomal protein S24, mitochondrial [Erysiphe necator]KHJ36100.1 putative 37s ribosomal protein [Erysiphe necator]
MATIFWRYWLRNAYGRSLTVAHHHSKGIIPKFSTTAASQKEPKFEDIFPNVRKSSRLSGDEYAKIEEYVKKDLADPDQNDDQEEDFDGLSRMFLNENDNPVAYDDNNDLVSNKFWENVFSSSYTMKKLDAPEKPPKLKQTFMNMGEAEPWEQEGMLPDDEDDLTSLGHGELELHRELRHYARLAAWEMPLLYNLRKPFKLPTEKTPLRFRYTTYMGEQHPAENKVVLEFCILDIPDLTEIQRDKLRKLAGTRWNPAEDVVKMSCESYETQAQNKRYLGNVFESLLREAKNEEDNMQDIPLYTKHFSSKKIPRFPKEWIMTENRRNELAKHRRESLRIDEKKEKAGLLIDGIKCIKEIEEKETLQQMIPVKA